MDSLNDEQKKAVELVHKFIEADDQNKMLLLGCAGSGKTTTIVNAFNGSKYRILFCAFTNKATQILKTKCKINANFATIHKAFGLEPKYSEYNLDIGLSFKFNINKTDHLNEYDIIVFDECSTISTELYNYISQTMEFIKSKEVPGQMFKYIFIGDFWQLPPVGEKSSVVFNVAMEEKWLIGKLNTVMRAANDEMLNINKMFADEIQTIKSSRDTHALNNFVHNFPRQFNDKYFIGDIGRVIDTYLLDKEAGRESMVITYSRANCGKINRAIQEEIDLRRAASTQAAVARHYEIIKNFENYFYPGDRCTINTPIDYFPVKTQKIKYEISPVEYYERIENYNENMEPFIKDEFYANQELEKRYKEYVGAEHILARLSESSETGEAIYSGDIFEISDVCDCLIRTNLNTYNYIPKYFFGQILTINKIGSENKYQILHIFQKQILDAKKKIKTREGSNKFVIIMNEFIRKYPMCEYGYCITLYKSQGSEWQNIIVNMNSIYYSVYANSAKTQVEKKMLLKSAYTASTRASESIKIFWY